MTIRRHRAPLHATGVRVVLAAEGRGAYDGAGGPSAGEASRSRDGRTVTDLVAELADVLGDVTRQERLAGLDDPALAGLVADLQRLDGLATTHLALAVRAAHRGGMTRRHGAASATEWLKASGRSGREAARLVRLGTNLDDLPATRDALSNGDLTAEAADVLVRTSADGRLGGPAEVERQLLDTATTSTPDELRADVRRRQQAVDGEALLRDERRQHANRRVSLTRGGDGMWRLSGLLAGEPGARLRTAMDAFDHRDGPDVPRECRRTADQRLADALAGVVGTVLDRGLTPSTGGTVRPHLTAIVDADVLRADLAATDDDGSGGAGGRVDGPIAPDDDRWAELPPAETDWGDVLSPQAIRRVLCDAAVSRVVLAGGSQVLDAGRTRRDWSGAQRRAINARDRTCRGPGCTRPIAWTQVHHIRWWSKHGETSVDNGIALCHHCHRLVHDVGWNVDHDLATATATWTAPDGRVVTTRPPPPPGSVTPGRGSGRDGGVDPASRRRDPDDRRRTATDAGAPGVRGSGRRRTR